MKILASSGSRTAIRIRPGSLSKPEKSHLSGRRILFMYNVCGLGGVETSIINRCAAFEQLGLETHLLFQSYWGDGGRMLGEHSAISVLETENQQLALINEWQPSCIVVVDWPRFIGVVKRSSAQCPLILETHMSDLEAFSRRRISDAANDPRVAMVAAPSEFNRSVLVKHSIDPKRIRIIPNAIDINRFRLRANKASDVGDVPGGIPLILFVGRIEPQKNVLEFVRVCRTLLESGQDFHAIVIGDSVDTQQYSRLVDAEANPIMDRFTFIAKVSYEDMPALYQRVASSGGCLLSTSLHESQPMIVLEAMASGCPVVASDVGGLSEIVKHGVTGRLYRLGAVDSAARQINELLTDASARAAMVDAAMRYVESRHAFSTVAASYHALFEEVGVVHNSRA